MFCEWTPLAGGFSYTSTEEIANYYDTPLSGPRMISGTTTKFHSVTNKQN